MDLKLEVFEGPLDLLLHLIKENKMDIFDIEIESITRQYLDYIHKMKEQNLDIASSYLVMASELTLIKARMLLPRPKVDEEETEEEDPREELVARLLEYQAYKEITKTLKENESKRQEIHTKLPENINNYIEENTVITGEGSIDLLVDAFKKFLVRKSEEKPLSTKVTMKEITVSSRKLEIKSILKKEKRVSFFKLFPVSTKEYIVATFLAILDMARNKELLIKQEELFSDIIVEGVS
ncbi:MAG TPA: segregation/condensation protein A [Candidatus Onthousia faecipullorum]|uniref:Segregation and condensation protein A n=1 Tax=Candidatus Onthousia faecipullorum TaxID=2840887 RepID=A0A9D1GA61_9FIRM|nr:segregation/condensation protein A [Candidatus Onthousia faecipullorum]